MAARTRRALTSSEITQHGQALYERDILPTLDPSSRGKFLVLDVETGAYEVDRDGIAALQRVRNRRPGASVYLVRVGFPTAYRIGRGTRFERPC